MGSEQNKIRLYLAGIVILAILAIFFVFPQQIENSGLNLPSFMVNNFRLGLDLQGGTHLEYAADVSKTPAADQASAVEGVRDVIERRVNAFGVAEPVIQTNHTAGGWRVIVELAGVSDVNQAINMIGETPLLEFKEQNPNPQIKLTEAETKELTDFNTAAKTKAESLLKQATAFGADFATLAKNNSEDPGSKANGGDLGFVERGKFDPAFEAVCFDKLKDGQTNPELVQTTYGYHIIKRISSKTEADKLMVDCQHILIKTKSATDYGQAADQWLYTGLTGKQLSRAQVQFEQNTQSPEVSLEFNDEGKKLFGAITTRNIGKPVAIFLDGTAISIPTVQTAIMEGKAVINGSFTIQEAKLLAQRLNAGALPIPITLISQQTIGASLGNQSVDQSMKAGILSLILICAFMILYYRLPGLVASVALILYGLVLLSIFKILNVTLTLAGIAGFILSLGMAVDANVLIFERFKEEIRWGKPLTIALNEGFKRAWSSIWDGHISTLISCVILMGFSTSLVKGFAIILALGTLMSLFSAVVVTRIILKAITRISAIHSFWLFGVKKKNISTNN